MPKTDLFHRLGRTASAAILLAAWAHAQGKFSYAGCDDVAESQFKYVPIVSRNADPGLHGAAVPLLINKGLSEPIHMAFDMQSNGKVDIYFTERWGSVKRYNGSTNTLDSLGQINVATGGEMGLTGIAVDASFKSDRLLYVFYTAPGNELRLSKIPLNAAGDLDLARESILIKYKSIAGRHMGGALAFDAYGDLWISTGNDASDYPSDYSETNAGGSSESSSANAADFRGGVLRIHPDNSAKGYSIPAGNYSGYWSGYFKDKDAALSNEYLDTAKVRPEVYAKGTRNAYSISVDSSKRWVSYGNFGINTQNTYTEAHYLLTHPAFGGYPYFAGGFGTGSGSGYYELWSGPGAAKFSASHPGLSETIGAPVNDSKWNLGPKRLPPVTPGMHTYSHGSGAGAVTGPFYRYNGKSPSAVKWPPHFQDTWMLTDFNQGGLRGLEIYKLAADGSGLIDSLNWFKTLGWSRPISMEQGPDGAIYVIMYSGWFGPGEATNIGRLEYTGNCHPDIANAIQAQPGIGMRARGPGLEVSETGAFTLLVRDLRGRELNRLQSQGPASFSLQELAPEARGILSVTVASGKGERRIALFKE